MPPTISEPAIYTIGHSTRPLDQFIALLNAHNVKQLADVRTVPRSRRHPHFSREALSRSRSEAGIQYRHFAALGGLRKPRADSTNTAWRHAGFRGYADYMETPAFALALDELLAFADIAPCRVLGTPEGGGASASVRGGGAPRTVITCAEAVWWRCHRQLIADALVARGIEVRHIGSTSQAPRHSLTDFALIEGQMVAYRRLI